MVTRSLVLVLLHAWCALSAYGVSFLVIEPAHAGTNEWTYQSGATGYNTTCLPRTSLSAVVACIGGMTVGNGVDVTCQVNASAGSTSLVSGTTWQATVTIETENWNAFGCQGTFSSAGKVVRFTDSCTPPATFDGNECYTPPDCSMYEGDEVDRFFSGSTAGGPVCATAPGSESTECDALVASPAGTYGCAGGECFARLVFTGEQCGGEPDATGEDLVDEPGNMNCVSGDGTTFCASQSSQNCGTVNGQSVCLDSIPPGRCTFLGNGGMVCASSASSPPAPSDEMGTSPATPDGTFSAGSDDASEQDYDYFGPGTVADSGTPTSGTSTTIISDGGDDGEEPGEEEPFAGPDLGETTTFGEALASFMAAAGSTPLISAASGIGASMPAGECPAPSLVVPYLDNVELTLDAHCELWEEISIVFTMVMLAVWVFIGARIVLSA